MQRSPNFYFPDVNVWLALTFRRHTHQVAAWTWLGSVAPQSKLYFCRFTQIGLLRLLTTSAVMESDGAMNQKEAWEAYDRWTEDDRVDFHDEPAELEIQFRSLTQRGLPSPKGWVDAYLATFAAVAGLRFVTFDRGFRGRVDNLLLLEP